MAASSIQCELIAPAGSWASARAAVENGADAIYFGLQKGINARAKAVNFQIEELPELMFYLHQRGVKGFLTLNTLVFAEELAAAEGIARDAIRSGVDAFIVQDVGLLRLLHVLCPDFPLHASTQMTLSSAECIEAVEDYGVKRAVLPRELSLAQIAAIRRATSIELEVFVHGALCISYSGQCLASLALGGRSGNRGQCAQACRMAYELLENGAASTEEAKRYWLSPRDLGLWDRLPDLLAAGVSAIKIEGRMKEPEYVALTTQCYRRALDAALAGRPFKLEAQRVEELEVAFSRGFSAGWIDGPRPQALVPGENTAKRGVLIGTVSDLRVDRIRAGLIRSVRRGQGIVFEELHNQDAEQGGRIYEIFVNGQSVSEADGGSEVELTFGRNDLDLRQIQPGGRIYRTDDPRLMTELRKSFDSAVPRRRVHLDLVVRATVGEKLHLEGLPMTPLSVLGQLRRAIVAALDDSMRKTPDYSLPDEPLLSGLRDQARRRHAAQVGDSSTKPHLHVLCRSVEQVEAALTLDVDTIYADLSGIEDYAGITSLVRFAGKKIYLATMRIHHTDTAATLEYLESQRPDGILARHLAGLVFFHRAGLPVIADYSLNATNDLTVQTLREKGANRVTAAFDFSQKTFADMARHADPRSLEVILHCHVPMFHTAHCLYCAAFSNRNAKPQCGRSCLNRQARLRDRKGCEHPVLVDADCRNTVFHAQPQSLAEYGTWLLGLGVRHFRIELLDHSAAETTELIALYRDLLDGRRDEKDVLQQLCVARSGNVTRGTWRFGHGAV